MNQDFKKFFIDELRDIYSAEMQLMNALPQFAAAAESPELREAITAHLGETNQQVERLKRIFTLLHETPQEKKCEAMAGLIKEANETLQEYSRSFLKDAALITKAQRIEHYEIAVYGALRTFADQMDLSEISDLLQTSLNEEGGADKKLTKIAKGGLFTSGVNQKARGG